MEPYLKQNLLNLRQQEGSEEETLMENEAPTSIWHDIHRSHVTGGQEDVNTHIISTSDIDNYFNLQITTQLWFGSQ